MKTVVVILFVLLAGCATKGQDPYQMEYRAYRAFLIEQHESGKLTLAEMMMLDQAKASELMARQAAERADRMSTMGLGWGLMQQR